MIVWGGEIGLGGPTVNTGYRYNPTTDAWAPISTVNAPSARRFHTAIWTGSDMLIWGGEGGDSGPTLNTGARYDPTTDTWTPMSTLGAPGGRYLHAAVWTGSELLVWGGDTVSAGVIPTDTGGRYSPSSDTWQPISSAGAPSARTVANSVWTGSEMIVWGGATDYQCVCNSLNTGARYNPATDSWATMSTQNTPDGLSNPSVVWSGSAMIVWGGATTSSTYVNSGRRYDPTTDTWTTIQTSGAPSPRIAAVPVWTGSEMIVWGGYDGNRLNSGGRYDPATDTWVPTTLSGAPTPRNAHTAVWTGDQMIVWGGFHPTDAFIRLNTGGRYDPGAPDDLFTYPLEPTQAHWHNDYDRHTQRPQDWNTCYNVTYDVPYHAGQDYGFPAVRSNGAWTNDTAVGAVADGVVRYSSKRIGTKANGTPIYGGTTTYPGGVVIIEHVRADGTPLYSQYGSPIFSMYAHLDPDKIQVGVGDRVSKGVTVIATGLIPQVSTDKKTGAIKDNTHLHWEMRFFYDGSGIKQVPRYRQACATQPGPGYTYSTNDAVAHPDNFQGVIGINKNGSLVYQSYHWTNPPAFVDTH
jgi:hypothetical protein